MPETTVELIQTGPEEAELIRNLYQYYAYESSDWEQEDVEAAVAAAGAAAEAEVFRTRSRDFRTGSRDIHQKQAKRSRAV